MAKLTTIQARNHFKNNLVELQKLKFRRDPNADGMGDYDKGIMHTADYSVKGYSESQIQLEVYNGRVLAMLLFIPTFDEKGNYHHNRLGVFSVSDFKL